MNIVIIFSLIFWYAIGLYSFYYWWTKDADIDTNPELLLIWFSVGFLGIFTWFIGRNIHSDKPTKNRVLFKKRK